MNIKELCLRLKLQKKIGYKNMYKILVQLSSEKEITYQLINELNIDFELRGRVLSAFDNENYSK